MPPEVPMTRASVLVALATMGGVPKNSKAGKVTKVPPPATALIAPPAAAATNKPAISVKVIRLRVKLASKPANSRQTSRLTTMANAAILHTVEHVACLGKFLDQHLPSALEMLRQMVEINSFTANKEGVNRLGRVTAEFFTPLGFVAEFVPSINPAWGDHLVLTRAGRSSNNIAMVSHLDTVFPPEEELQTNFRWQPEGDIIFGPGTHDIKGGTAMMWLVLSALKNCVPWLFEQITWKLFWNSSEECFSADFGDVCKQRFDRKTLAALVFEAEGRADKNMFLVVARK